MHTYSLYKHANADFYLGSTNSCTNFYAFILIDTSCIKMLRYALAPIHTYTHTQVYTHPHLWKALSLFSFPDHTHLMLCSRAQPCSLGTQVFITYVGRAEKGPTPTFLKQTLTRASENFQKWEGFFQGFLEVMQSGGSESSFIVVQSFLQRKSHAATAICKTDTGIAVPVERSGHWEPCLLAPPQVTLRSCHRATGLQKTPFI